MIRTRHLLYIWAFTLAIIGCSGEQSTAQKPAIEPTDTVAAATEQPTLMPTATRIATPRPPSPTATPTNMPPTATPTPTQAPTATFTPTPLPPVRIAAVGDIMLARTLGDQINWGRVDYPFEKVRESLSAADITVGNLESALGDVGEAQPKSYAFQAPPAAAESLANAGFDLLTLANNHALDYGPESLVQALELLHGQNVKTVGAGANADEAVMPAVFEVNGMRIGFLGYANVPVEWHGFDTRSWQAGDAPGIAWGEPESVAAQVAQLAETVDHVIVLMHSGYEYKREPSPEQQRLARAAVDAGATAVIGHHAHLLQGVEWLGDGVIVYGLGNFAFDIDGEPYSAILHLWLDADGVQRVDFEPVILQPGGQPRPAGDQEAQRILEIISDASEAFEPADDSLPR